MTYGNHPPGGPEQGPPPQEYPYGPGPVDPTQQAYGGYQAPGAHPPSGAYPPPSYPPLGAYPTQQPGVQPPPAYPPLGGYPPSGAYPPPGGYPAQGGYPQPGGYPPPAPQGPTGRTNTLANLSVVFAILFAPVGALLGHLALGEIKRTGERGRDRALIGLTLSYAIVVFAVLALVLTLAAPDRAGETTTVAGDVPTLSPSAPLSPGPSPAPPRQSRVDISKALLSLDEVRQIMNTPGLTEASGGGSASGSGSDKDVKADPPECVSAVAAGIDTVYEGKGGRDYKRASYSDNSAVTIVDQVVVGFTDAAAAKKFVADSRTQWQRCAGKRFTLESSSGTITWDIGTPFGSPQRIEMESIITVGPGVPQYRVLAVKGSVVVDVAVVSRSATTEPDEITDRILARLPS